MHDGGKVWLDGHDDRKFDSLRDLILESPLLQFLQHFIGYYADFILYKKAYHFTSCRFYSTLAR